MSVIFSKQFLSRPDNTNRTTDSCSMPLITLENLFFNFWLVSELQRLTLLDLSQKYIRLTSCDSQLVSHNISKMFNNKNKRLNSNDYCTCLWFWRSFAWFILFLISVKYIYIFFFENNFQRFVANYLNCIFEKEK